MPRVPISKRVVSEEVMGNVRMNTNVNEEAFGGGAVTRARMAAADQLTKSGFRAIEAMDDFDKTEVKRTKRDLEKFINDQNAKFNLLKNKDPMLKRESFDKEYLKKYSELKKSLGNDGQRKLFEDIKDELDVGRDKSMGKHQLSEAFEYQNSEDDASIASAKTLAADNYSEPEVIATKLIDIENTYKDKALRNGMASTDKKGNIVLSKEGQRGLNEEISDAHYSVIKRAVNEGDDKLAKEHYEAIKDDKRLTKDIKDKMLKMVKESGELAEAQRFADSVVFGDKTREEALAEARKKYEGEQEKLAVTEIKQRFEEKERSEIRTSKKKYQIHMNELERTKGKYEPKFSDMAEMTPEQQNSFRRLKDYFIKEKEPPTDWTKWSDLMILARTAPDKFMKEDPNVFRAYMGDNEFKAMVKLQNAMSQKDSKYVNKYLSLGKEARALYQASGLAIKTKTQKEKYAKFEAFIQKEITDIQEARGKNLTPQERAEIINQALLEGEIVDGGFLYFDKSARLFEVPENELMEFKVKGHKPSEVIKAKQILKKLGKPSSTEDAIEMLNAIYKK